MHDVAVERGKVLVAVHGAQQIGAHRDERAGAARRAIQLADQFLAPRLGGKVEIAGVSVGRLRPPSLDRLGKFFPVRTEIAGQGFEECKPAGLIEIMVMVQDLARHRCAGGLASPGQERLAQFDSSIRSEACRLVSDDPARRSNVRPRSEIDARRSEKKALLLMSGGSNPG